MSTLKRTPFKRKAPAWRKSERVYRMPSLADPAAFRLPAVVDALACAAPKTAAVRSEAYRRAVAQLPCMYCDVSGYSQCAHANTGKGAGMKASDLDTFPLCCDRPGVRGCHSRFDQGALMTKAERRATEPRWIAATQAQIAKLGLWPKKVPQPQILQAMDAIKIGVNE